MTVINLYEVLGVAKRAKPDEIKKAYYILAKQYHPDKCKDESMDDKFKEITAAYDVLKDEDKRLMYDIELREFEERATAQERAFEEYFEKCSTLNRPKAKSSSSYKRNGTTFDFRSYFAESEKRSDSSEKKKSDKTGSGRRKSTRSRGEPKRTTRQKQTFDFTRPDWNTNFSHDPKPEQKHERFSNSDCDSLFDDLDDLLSSFPHAPHSSKSFKPMNHFIIDTDEKHGRAKKSKKRRDPLEEMWDWSKPLFGKKNDEFSQEESSEEDDSFMFTQRMPCYCCGRKINPSNLAAHEEACKQFFKDIPKGYFTEKKSRDRSEWKTTGANTERKKTSSDTDWKKTSSESDWKKPSSETDRKKPGPDTDWKKSSSNSDWKKPSSDTDWKKSSSDSEKRKTSSESDWKKPSSESDWKKPSSESDWKKPSSESDWKKPSSESDWKKPSSESDWKKPSSESDWKKPSVDSDWKKSTADSDWRKTTTDKGWKKSTDLPNGFKKASNLSAETKKDAQPTKEEIPMKSRTSTSKRNNISMDDAFIFLQSRNGFRPERNLSPPPEFPKSQKIKADIGKDNSDSHHHTFCQPGSQGFVFSTPDYVYNPTPAPSSEFTKSASHSTPATTIIGSAYAKFSSKEPNIGSGTWDTYDVKKNYASKYSPIGISSLYGLTDPQRAIPRSTPLSTVDVSLSSPNLVHPATGTYVVDETPLMSTNLSAHASPIGSRRSSLSSTNESRISDMIDLLTVPDKSSSVRSSPTRTTSPATRPAPKTSSNTYIPDSVAASLDLDSELSYQASPKVNATAYPKVHIVPVLDIPPYQGTTLVGTASINMQTPPSIVPYVPQSIKSISSKSYSSQYKRHTAPRISAPVDDLDFSPGLGSLKSTYPVPSMPNPSGTYKASSFKKAPVIVPSANFDSDDDLDIREISPWVKSSSKFRSSGATPPIAGVYGSGRGSGFGSSSLGHQDISSAFTSSSIPEESTGWSDLSADVDDSLGYSKPRPRTAASSRTHGWGSPSSTRTGTISTKSYGYKSSPRVDLTVNGRGVDSSGLYGSGLSSGCPRCRALYDLSSKFSCSCGARTARI